MVTTFNLLCQSGYIVGIKINYGETVIAALEGRRRHLLGQWTRLIRQQDDISTLALRRLCPADL